MGPVTDITKILLETIQEDNLLKKDLTDTIDKE